MDLYCRHCREPWDNDSLHGEVAERTLLGISSTYSEVAKQFRRFGCGAMFAFAGGTEPRICPDKQDMSDRDQAVIDAAYEACGDDMDGAASLMADYL